MGKWVGEIENKDQLSPTEVEIRTEFGNIEPIIIGFNNQFNAVSPL